MRKHNLLNRLLSKITNRRTRQPAECKSPRFRGLILEPLENRYLLTAIDEIGVGNGGPAYEGGPVGLIGFGRGRPYDPYYEYTDTLTIYYTIEGGSPNPASSDDYQIGGGGMMVLGPGVPLDYQPFGAVDDEEDEGTEALLVTITGYTSSENLEYDIVGPTAQVHIIDNDRQSFAEEVEEDTLAASSSSGCSCTCSCSTVSAGFNPMSGTVYAMSSAAGLRYDSGAVGAGAMIQADPSFGPSYTSQFGTPEDIEVQIEFNGVPVSTKFYNTAGIEAWKKYRFAERPSTAGLATGRYSWQMDVITPDGVHTVIGHTKVRNNLDSEFGRGWVATGIDRLQVESDGVLWLRGIGDVLFFENQGTAFLRQKGDPDFSTLQEETGGTYTLRNKYGDVLSFTADGVLTTNTDRLGNQTTYAYIDADGDSVADEISQITDPAGRVTTFGFVGDLVNTITDPFLRVTTLDHDASKRLTKITEPDPDGAGGPLPAPYTEFTYGGNLLASVKDPESNITQFGYTNGMVSGVTYPGSVVEAINSEFASAFAPGWVAASDIRATYTNEVQKTWFLRYNKFGTALSVVDPLGHETTYEVNDENLVTKRTDPAPGFGNTTRPVTTYSYSSGTLSGIGLPGGGSLSWTYDANFNQPTSFTDARGKQTLFTVNPANGNITAVRQIVGLNDLTYGETDDVVTNFTYTPLTAAPATNDTPAGYVASMTDPLGRLTTYTYVGRGLLSSITYAQGTADQATVEFGYDAYENPLWSEDELDRRTDYEFDKLDRQTKVTLPDPDGAGPLVRPVYRYEYNKNNYLTKETDPLSRVTQYVYSPRNDVTQIKRPDHDGDGNLTIATFGYDPHRRLISVKDPLDRITTLSYDALDRNIKVTLPDPDGAGSLAAPEYLTDYDDIGRVRKQTDPLLKETTYAYTGFVDQVQITQPDPDGGGQLLPPTMKQIFDDAGNLVETIDPMLRHTTYEYDDLNRLLKVREPNPNDGSSTGGPLWQDGYDKASNLKTITDPLNHATTYDYDNRDRRTKTTDPKNGQTTFTYDAAGQLLSLMDPKNIPTTWEYDALGRVTTESGWYVPRYFQYDDVGNLTEQIDRLGRRTVWEYDSLYHNTAEKWYDGETLVRTISYAYDAADRLMAASDPLAAVYSYQYDNLDRVKTESQSLANFSSLITYQSQYNAMNFRTELLAGVGGTADFKNTYTPDNLQRLTTLTQQGVSGGNAVAQKRVDFSYNAAGQFAKISRYAGLGTTEHVASSHYQYDWGGRLTKLVHSTSATPPPTGSSWGSSPLAGYQYTYDAASRITSINSYVDGLGTNTYDNTDQLKYVNFAGADLDETYNYDANGNRDFGPYVVYGNDLYSDGKYDYYYDQEGNRAYRNDYRGRTTAYTWDHRNRLVGASGSLAAPYPEDDGEETAWGWGSSSASGSIAVGPGVGQGTSGGWGWGSSSGIAHSSGVIDISANVQSATEGNNVTLTLSSNTSGPVDVAYWLRGVSAQQYYGGDYYLDSGDPWLTSGSVTIPNSGSPVQVPIFTVDDAYYESRESF